VKKYYLSFERYHTGSTNHTPTRKAVIVATVSAVAAIEPNKKSVISNRAQAIAVTSGTRPQTTS